MDVGATGSTNMNTDVGDEDSQARPPTTRARRRPRVLAQRLMHQVFELDDGANPRPPPPDETLQASLAPFPRGAQKPILAELVKMGRQAKEVGKTANELLGGRSGYRRFLRSAKHTEHMQYIQENWRAVDGFAKLVPREPLGQTLAGYLVSIARHALSRGLELPSLIQPGGVLHAVSLALDPPQTLNVEGAKTALHELKRRWPDDARGGREGSNSGQKSSIDGNSELGSEQGSDDDDRAPGRDTATDNRDFSPGPPIRSSPEIETARQLRHSPTPSPSPSLLATTSPSRDEPGGLAGLCTIIDDALPSPEVEDMPSRPAAPHLDSPLGIRSSTGKRRAASPIIPEIERQGQRPVSSGWMSDEGCIAGQMGQTGEIIDLTSEDHKQGSTSQGSETHSKLSQVLSALQSLEDGTWLNDEAINIILSRLASPSVAVASTFDLTPFICGQVPGAQPSHTQTPPPPTLKARLLGKHVLLIPVHSRQHWQLAAWYERSSCLEWFDSGSPGACPREASAAHRFLAWLYNKSQEELRCTFLPQAVPSQPNTWDCGVYTIHFARYIARNRATPDYTPANVSMPVPNIEIGAARSVLKTQLLSSDLLLPWSQLTPEPGCDSRAYGEFGSRRRKLYTIEEVHQTLRERLRNIQDQTWLPSTLRDSCGSAAISTAAVDMAPQLIRRLGAQHSDAFLRASRLQQYRDAAAALEGESPVVKLLKELIAAGGQAKPGPTVPWRDGHTQASEAAPFLPGASCFEVMMKGVTQMAEATLEARAVDARNTRQWRRSQPNPWTQCVVLLVCMHRAHQAAEVVRHHLDGRERED